MGSCLQDFAEGPLAQQNLDAGANMLIPVPSPLGGVIVIGESVIAYFAEGQAMKVTPIKQTIIRVRCDTAAWAPSLPQYVIAVLQLDVNLVQVQLIAFAAVATLESLSGAALEVATSSIEADSVCLAPGLW